MGIEEKREIQDDSYISDLNIWVTIASFLQTEEPEEQEVGCMERWEMHFAHIELVFLLYIQVEWSCQIGN